jgi:hypothetical protein
MGALHRLTPGLQREPKTRSFRVLVRSGRFRGRIVRDSGRADRLPGRDDFVQG